MRHAAVANEAELDIHWVNAEEIEADDTDMAKVMAGVDGILVPGGFGNRGIEGKIKAIQYAREHKIPFFGICLGMQCAVIAVWLMPTARSSIRTAHILLST